MIGSILVGSVLTVITVGIHATSTAWWIGRLKMTGQKATRVKIRFLPLRMLCSTALLLILLHLVEVLPWATAYMLLPGLDAFHSFEESAYFATVTFASLGYGDIVIRGPWRMLSGIQAMNGLLVFGWSTALLFAVVERIWGGDDALGEDLGDPADVLRIPSPDTNAALPSDRLSA